MERIVKWSSILMLSAVLAACASAGRDFDRTHVHDVKKGVHDKAQIRAWFGDPLRVSTIDAGGTGCNERWVYNHARVSFGGHKQSGGTLVIGFDKKDKVCLSTYTETNK